MIKPRVFIGSASESLAIAEEVRSKLSTDFNVSVWTDDIFKSNETPLQTLLTEAGLFDFGIMILSKDDHSESRGEGFETPRDNTLFEFGIFLGRIGDGRAFALAEDGVKLPSDLFGVTIEHYAKDTDDESYNSLNKGIGRISKQMMESARLGFLGMLPSTALAIGYFNNFVKDVAESIAGGLVVTHEELQFSVNKLYIVIPNDLDSDMKRRASIYYQARHLTEIQFPAKHRSRPLYVEVADGADSCAAFDLPTTLDGVDKAIDMYLRRGYIGKTDRQRLLEEHELSNFKRVLELLINDDSFTKKFVRIIPEV